MKIDLDQLSAHASRLHAERKTRIVGVRTGATDIITAALPVIEQLRAQGVGWAEIAAALAAQGVVQGADRKALSGRRLCALLSAIRKRDEGRARKQRARHTRRDVVARQDAGGISIAPELAPQTQRRSSAPSESALRIENFVSLQSLLKGESK